MIHPTPRLPYTRILFVAPSALSLRLKRSNYKLSKFPSLKGYQIGRELPRTLTRSLREGLNQRVGGGGSGGGVGARFLKRIRSTLFPVLP